MNNGLASALGSWSALDAEARDCNSRLQELRKQRKSLSGAITSHLSDSGHPPGSILKLGGQKLRFTSTSVKQPLTLAIVRRALGRCIEGEEDIETIMSLVQEERGKVTVLDLKRMRPE